MVSEKSERKKNQRANIHVMNMGNHEIDFGISKPIRIRIHQNDKMENCIGMHKQHVALC